MASITQQLPAVPVSPRLSVCPTQHGSPLTDILRGHRAIVKLERWKSCWESRVVALQQKWGSVSFVQLSAYK